MSPHPIAELLELLKDAEWAHVTWDVYPTCPWCFGLDPENVPAIDPRYIIRGGVKYFEQVKDDRGHRDNCKFINAMNKYGDYLNEGS